jgi:hypothetical protein
LLIICPPRLSSRALAPMTAIDDGRKKVFISVLAYWIFSTCRENQGKGNTGIVLKTMIIVKIKKNTCNAKLIPILNQR